MIRPQPARWFEAVCARDDAFVLLEALAAGGCAEIEWHAGSNEREAAQANRLLKDFAALSRQYRAYWPAAVLRDPAACKVPMAAFESAMATLGAWAADNAATIASLQQAQHELAQCAVMQRVLDALEASGVDLRGLASAGGALSARVLVFPPGSEPAIPPAVLLLRFTAEHEAHALVLGAADAIDALERETAALRGSVVPLPNWLGVDATGNRAALGKRIAELEAVRAASRAALDASVAKHELGLALGDIARASWCFQNVGAVDAKAQLARITGWTDDPAALSAAVEESPARALATFPAAPPGASPPLLLRNPWWARPFEFFIRLFGVPGREGADPSVLLAFFSPLLFGYMFGDVGQGAVLLVAGLLLRKRYPDLRLLIPGGIAAMGFGVLFGSVFAFEGILHPLWVAPLQKPLEVLVVPLYAGALLLTLGLALRALEAYWRRDIATWLRCEAGLIAVYLGIVATPLTGAGPWVAAAGGVAFLVGHAVQAQRAGAALGAVGELVERTLQILVNTVSFARVGAFALAHAGLSAAVIALAHATGSAAGAAITVVAGNVLILVLEGLVVGIQTTRLILFEFFVRFFESRGREFRPLLPPHPTEAHP